MISCLSPSFPASFSFWICSSDDGKLLHFDANEGFDNGALEIQIYFMLKMELLIHVMMDTQNVAISTNFAKMQIQIN